ncbi:MAG: glycosyltransferase family 9 protein [Gammaproteobacteria bacterium]|nr:glycosyltransferase family 9 protein [Gammaproteobacteria bacterium]
MTDYQNLKSVLIFRLGSVGDTVVALPTFRLVKKAFPNTELSVLTNMPVSNKACALELILQNTEIIDKYVEYPSKSNLVEKCFAIRRLIKKNNYSTMIYMHQNRHLFHIWRDFLFFKFCGVKKIIGLPLFEHGFHYLYDKETKLYECEHKRLARQLKALGGINWADEDLINLALTENEFSQARGFIPTEIINKPFIVCSIGTKLAVKDWGQDNWKKMISALSENYAQIPMVFIGVEDEFERSAELLNCWNGPVLNLCGKLSVRQSSAVLSYSKLFIGHDSGPMHLAAAVNVPCVAIFSRHAKPGCWFPWGKQHKVIYPIRKSIRSITINDVVLAVTSILSNVIKQHD